MENLDNKPVIIVSGLPRSGTSLMMNMLQNGGVVLQTDQIRTADEDNPKGYFEFERSKALKEGDFSWVADARGKAVKVISALLKFLPANQTYQVVFMLRDLQEVLDSQRQMLVRRKENPESIQDADMKVIYERHLATIKEWLNRQPNFTVLNVSYNQMLVAPDEIVGQIGVFLGRDLDQKAMLSVVDPNLYRQRKS